MNKILTPEDIRNEEAQSFNLNAATPTQIKKHAAQQAVLITKMQKTMEGMSGIAETVQSLHPSVLSFAMLMQRQINEHEVLQHDGQDSSRDYRNELMEATNRFNMCVDAATRGEMSANALVRTAVYMMYTIARLSDAAAEELEKQNAH